MHSQASLAENLLRCPRCKGSLKIKASASDNLGIVEGQSTCQQCGQAYPIRGGIFFLQPGKETVPDSDGWDLATFDAEYRAKGNIRSNVDWAENTGVPKAIADYDHPRIKGRLISWLRMPDNGALLDVGAGSGYFIFDMMQHIGKDGILYVGIDPSAEYIKWLERRRRDEGLTSVLTVVGDSRALPFSSSAFDIVVCSEVLEHVPDKARAIAEMSACLKPGGNLLLSTPSKAAFDFWDFVTAPLRWALRTRQGPLPYDRPIYASQLRKFLTDSGLVIDTFEMNVILPPQSYFSRMPRFCAPVFTTVCGFLEKYFKWLLASRFALHMVVRSTKKG